MKTERMSLQKMKSVLHNVLGRDEMKEVMAGSGGGACGTRCSKVDDPNAPCYQTPGDPCLCANVFLCY